VASRESLAAPSAARDEDTHRIRRATAVLAAAVLAAAVLAAVLFRV
jgi:hypothetical protein